MRLTPRMLLSSSALAAVVALVFAVLLVAIGSLREAGESARHAEQVVAQANRLERLVIDLQTGARGYIITRQERFLDPWKSALRTYPREAEVLVRLARVREQDARARAISRAIRTYAESWAIPLVRIARNDPRRARELVASGQGKREVDALRRQFDVFIVEEQKLARTRRDRAEDRARQAIVIGAAGLGGSVILVLLFAGYLTRLVVGPVRRVAAAADQISRGDLAARVPDEGRRDEIGTLGRAFNAMAVSLQESRDELETQTAELELQTSELEERQEELATANDELQAQRGELERALAELDEEKGRVETFYAFAQQLAAETDLDRLAAVVLSELSEFAAAEVGVCYLVRDEAVPPQVVATRGLSPERVPPEIAPGSGLVGRALVERTVVSTDHGESGLRITSFGQDVVLRHELHAPLVLGERVLGVVSIARAGDRPFGGREIEALDHLASQAAGGIANVMSLEAARRQVAINSAVLDATVDGIRLVDVHGRTIISNRAIEDITTKVFGLAPGLTLYERNEALADRLVDPEGFRATSAALAADLERAQLDEFELADSRRVFQRYTAPVRDQNGQLIGRIIILREVTAEREAERLKSELVATVSHELRTPLASVLGFAELLSERDLDPGTQKRYLGTIYGEARRLTQLVNDFLDLQRIEEGRFSLKLEPFALDDVVREQVEVFSGQSAAHRLELSLPDERLEVAGDRDRISQVVANLLSNAIKYSPEGGVVGVEAAGRDGVVRVSVRDPGLGIPSEQQRQIFTKFFRVDSSDTREIGGTGLGLALCRDIVEAHGGHIGFESVEGRGSTFWFDLPASRTPSQARPPHVLVIEDDPATASLLAETIRGEGYGVEFAATGERGIELALGNPPALVCLDLCLAGDVDGWQVLSRLKEAPQTANVPVLVCTGSGGENQAGVLGAADFLAKPFSSQRLRETIERLLPGGRGSVLVVEDEESVRSLVVATLRGNGLTLREARDGEEALEAVAAERPDVVILDLMMPKVDGFEVLERLQADPATRTIPVVILTARRLDAEERNSLKSRATALLEKSRYSASELRQIVRQALGDER